MAADQSLGDLVRDFVGVGEPRGPEDRVVQSRFLNGVCLRTLTPEPNYVISEYAFTQRADCSMTIIELDLCKCPLGLEG